MKYWLLKTEPEDWSWTDQLNAKNKSAEWNGVRNYQASKNLKKMKKNDLCFFYHTGKEKKIVGIVKVVKEYFKDLSLASFFANSFSFLSMTLSLSTYIS